MPNRYVRDIKHETRGWYAPSGLMLYLPYVLYLGTIYVICIMSPFPSNSEGFLPKLMVWHSDKSLPAGTLYNIKSLVSLWCKVLRWHKYLESTKSQPYCTQTDLETTLSESCSEVLHIILWSAQIGKWLGIIALVAIQEGNLFMSYIHTMRMKRFIHTEWTHLVRLIQYIPNLLPSMVFKCLLAINVHVRRVQKELWILI